MQRPTNSPDYISWSDWQAKQNSRTAKSRRLATWVATFVALAIAAVVLIPPTISSSHAKAVARMLDSMGLYDAKIYTYGAASS